MLFDVLIFVVLLVCVVSAARSGLVVEVFELAGLILGLLLASWDYQQLMPWVGSWIHSLPMAQAASFLLFAVGVMIVAAVVGRIVRWTMQSMGLGWADRIAGAAFGLVKGCVLVTIAVMVVAAFWPQATWLRHSRLAPSFLAMAHSAAAVAPADLERRIREGVVVLKKDQPEWMKPAA
ncbi:MAG: CvpA family protein [Acidobacteriaceae bacterium]